MDNKKITKNIVIIIINIFTIIIILTAIFIISYYITPNNYLICEYDENQYIFEKEIEYDIEKKSIIELNHLDYLNYYLKFNSNADLIIKNILKSQNILCLENEIIYIKYKSYLIIRNNDDLQKKIKVMFYKKKSENCLTESRSYLE